jgi:hypothetical protein
MQEKLKIINSGACPAKKTDLVATLGFWSKTC